MLVGIFELVWRRKRIKYQIYQEQRLSPSSPWSFSQENSELVAQPVARSRAGVYSYPRFCGCRSALSSCPVRANSESRKRLGACKQSTAPLQPCLRSCSASHLWEQRKHSRYIRCKKLQVKRPPANRHMTERSWPSVFQPKIGGDWFRINFSELASPAIWHVFLNSTSTNSTKSTQFLGGGNYRRETTNTIHSFDSVSFFNYNSSNNSPGYPKRFRLCLPHHAEMTTSGLGYTR